MRTLKKVEARLVYLLITAGVIAGIASYVRLGSVFIALGTGVIAINNRGARRIEMYLPLAIAVALLALAIALPRGR